MKMIMKTISQKRKRPDYRAQAMVEFAITLPILLALLIGIMEVSRMVLMYTLVVNASRDAVRYASAIGRDDTSPYYFRYKYCKGIKDTAQTAAYFVPLSAVSIDYYDDKGVYFDSCTATSGEDDVSVDSKYSVKVTTTANYSPMIKFLPIKIRPFTAASTRTILGVYDLPNK
jgi:Flp pilus assembly protein TadG